MLDKSIAEHIYKVAEDELLNKGETGFHTILLMKEAVNAIGKTEYDYFYPDGEKMMFNLKRWKRHFLEDR